MALALAVVIMGGYSLPAGASNLSDLRDKKKQTENKKEAAQQTLNQLQNEQNDIISAITTLDQQVADYTAQIDELEAQKAELEDSIATKKSELADAKKAESEQYEAMKLRIQYSYENGDDNFFSLLFTSGNISDMVNEQEYASQVYSYDSNMLANLVKIKEEIADKEAQLEEELQEVEDIEAEVNEDKEAVEIMIEGKQTQLESYRNSIGDYEGVLAQLAADEAALDAQIEEAERQAREAAEAAAAAGNPVVINYTGGAFQWPVSTGGVITSTFGPRWGTVHRGLDIGCPTGTPIVAGESGTVIGAGYEGSMGNYVIIDHGGGVTTVYMHNSSLCCSTGDSVARGQVIALAGSTGDSTGPHCHFGLRINGEYVDPYPYLAQ